MIKKTLAGLLAVSLFTAPAAVFAAPNHSFKKAEKNYIQNVQKRVDKQIKQVVNKEAKAVKQVLKKADSVVKQKLSTEAAKKQLINPDTNAVRVQLAKLEVKQVKDKKALLTAIAGNKFDVAQTALATLKVDYDQIAALRAQLKNGTTPAPVPAAPASTTTEDSISVQSATNDSAGQPVAAQN
ncbi:hypothetical protein PP175_12435 [Aneurinibacillus sp. Ricciae_BoGa-3]|uniref:hypothetical protein n=1 Tax=Aneurinibacillus sp. Ricciae_BoGa-3 TaxID=3022697 RepID=UPI0023426FB8|nr:hypothetical protein [Aneurinibacillus sp. Ricciae_BoGa-3]WCK56645.1 hypothetical protein PP175_12435 [Aneurinibacillus sp. Ricciae_BoGa-3]